MAINDDAGAIQIQASEEGRRGLGTDHGAKE
jgi:hypothetical protein